MNEIEVVVDVRQSPNSAELIVVKQKLVTADELYPVGSPIETRLDLAAGVGGDNLSPSRNGAGLTIHRRAQPVFDTLAVSDRSAVLDAVTTLCGVEPEHWPPDRVFRLQDTSVHVVRATPELLVLITRTEHQGVEIVDIVHRATLDQFTVAELGGAAKP
jgi:hypothetical protein